MTVAVEDVVDYIGVEAAVRWAVVDVNDVTTYPQIEDALAAEVAAQAKKVTYPTDENAAPIAAPDLDEALKRRVQRNLAMRALPLSMTLGDGEGMAVRIGGTDPEIRRLEGPYRRRVVG